MENFSEYMQLAIVIGACIGLGLAILTKKIKDKRGSRNDNKGRNKS